MVSRRRFLQSTGALAAGFFGLRALCTGAAESGKPASIGYGPLITDPDEVLDLPEGFSYQILSRGGDELDDGLLLPGKPDGMATFRGPRGTTIIVRNHELTPVQGNAFGDDNELLSSVDRELLYDYGKGKTPGAGGTSTLAYDTKRKRVVRQSMSLLGTTRNCAGGPTPWNTWVSCEETVDRAGYHVVGFYHCEKDHGYPFEVPARAEIAPVKPVPLKGMGRFNHEAIAVDRRSGVVYETEDRHEGLLYRYIPQKKGKLAEGGRLQALKIAGEPSTDTRNWNGETIPAGRSMPVEWIDLEGIESPEDDLRFRGFDAGAARFARGEGIWAGDGEIYIACTNGGAEEAGQIWRYVPSPREGTAEEKDEPGRLELFVESHDSELLEHADNLTIAPWGDLIVCEDHGGDCRLIGVTPEGRLYTFASNHLDTELAGVCFSPDGSTLFVNLQHADITVAVTGPWEKRSA